MNLGLEIRRRRKVAGLPLRKMAETVKVSPAYLSRVERGLAPPSNALIRAVAHALSADSEELLLLAGRLPPQWLNAITASPARAVATLRGALATCVAEPTSTYGRTVLAFEGTRALEDPLFPFEYLSDIAQLESWRKEINRPIYHIHKWWAQRLGSVFRAILLAAFTPKGSDILEIFYQPARLTGAVIFDPFMGSGTTLGEALKLGARAIGRDINPVAHFAVKNALAVHPRRRIVETFQAIERDVASTIRHFYRSQIPRGESADVLYYFWVKVVPCPKCEQPVDLFSSYVFVRHAYPARNPGAQALCPNCGGVSTVRYDAESVTCARCHKGFNAKAGPANGAKATCPTCRHHFSIIGAVQRQGIPPRHRLYAKLVLRPDGTKAYLPADDFDRVLYNEAALALKKRRNAYPVVPIEPGYNTDQALKYCYRHWHEMFNDRQLLCLSVLAQRIRAIKDGALRDLFACLFSGVLEFNNMFTSFKGEGTGAVRHMFSHHILKPERTPLEANLWGTPKSSGAFSTLFESRLLRALDYCENPFELCVVEKDGKLISEKVYGLSCPLGYDVAETFPEFIEGKFLYLSCGDSAKTDLAPESVDAVVTDPPFFDNVHYSQLADFFHVWQRHILGKNGHYAVHSTRSSAEVQASDPEVFAERLRGVWGESHRVLRRGGLLVFTYHHSRSEGWRAILQALVGAGFVIVATHPIKAEMSVAAPKQQAKEPIDLDVILVCRKRTDFGGDTPNVSTVVADAAKATAEQVVRFNKVGRRLGRNDVRVVLMAQVIKRLSLYSSLTESLHWLDSQHTTIERTIGRVYEVQQVAERVSHPRRAQLALW